MYKAQEESGTTRLHTCPFACASLFNLVMQVLVLMHVENSQLAVQDGGQDGSSGERFCWYLCNDLPAGTLVANAIQSAIWSLIDHNDTIRRN